MSERRSARVSPSEVHERLAEYLLIDGYRLVLDAEGSHGSWLVDARDGREFLDLYTHFASAPLGANPPGIVDDPEFMALLARVAVGKPANPDMYTIHLAEFVQTFSLRACGASPTKSRPTIPTANGVFEFKCFINRNVSVAAFAIAIV